MNVLDLICSKADIRPYKDWIKSDYVAEEGSILGANYSNNSKDPIFDLEFRIADGIHPFRELESLSTAVPLGCQYSLCFIENGTTEEIDAKYNNSIPIKGLLIAEITEEGRKFKLANGFQKYSDLNYITNVSDFPIEFLFVDLFVDNTYRMMATSTSIQKENNQVYAQPIEELVTEFKGYPTPNESIDNKATELLENVKNMEVNEDEQESREIQPEDN